MYVGQGSKTRLPPPFPQAYEVVETSTKLRKFITEGADSPTLIGDRSYFRLLEPVKGW